MIGDVVTPTLSLLGDLEHGPSVRLVFSAGEGYSGADIEGYLKKHGIETWGAQVVGDYLTLKVTKAQLKLADIWLRRANIQYESG